jgi:hypothetical protein
VKIIKGIVPTPRRIMLYGEHGVGKGTWASKAPSPFFLDIEGGLNDIDCERTERLTNVRQVSEALTWLINEEHDYRTCVVDTVDWLEQLIHKQIVSDEGNSKIKTVADISYGKGYARAVPIWSWFLSQFEQLRQKRKMAIILLSHAKVERYESPESESYDRYSPDLHKSCSSMIQEWCDEVLFASTRVYTKKQDEGFNRSRNVAIGGKERFIRTSESASSIAKNRLSLPPELPLEWSAYMDCVRAYFANAKPPQVESKGADISGIVVNGSSKVTQADIDELKREAAETF